MIGTAHELALKPGEYAYLRKPGKDLYTSFPYKDKLYKVSPAGLRLRNVDGFPSDLAFFNRENLWERAMTYLTFDPKDLNTLCRVTREQLEADKGYEVVLEEPTMKRVMLKPKEGFDIVDYV